MMRPVVALLLSVLPVALSAAQPPTVPHQEPDTYQLLQELTKKRIELADQKKELRSSEWCAVWWPLGGLSAFIISAVSVGAYCDSGNGGTNCAGEILGHWAYVFSAGGVAHGIVSAVTNWIIRGRKVAQAANSAAKAAEDYNRALTRRRERARNGHAIGRPIPQAYTPFLPTATGGRPSLVVNQAWPASRATNRAPVRRAPTLPHLDSRGNLQPCTICQEEHPQTPVVAAPCGHTFCQMCIEAWRTTQDNQAIAQAVRHGTVPVVHFTCPNCNAPIENLEPVATDRGAGSEPRSNQPPANENPAWTEPAIPEVFAV